MRILMLSSLWPPAVIGGAELYAAELAEQLGARGHEVGVMTHGVDGPQVVASVNAWPARVDVLRTKAAWRRPVFHGRDIWRPGVTGVFRDAARRFRPDVVHSHVTTGMSVAALTAPGVAGVPHVHTLHDYWLRCWRSTMTRRHGGSCGSSCRLIESWRQTMVRRHRPEVLVAISEAILNHHPQLTGTRATRVLRHPAEVVEWRQVSSRDVRDAPVFGYIGQLTPNKGIDVLVDAAQRGEHQLVVAGRGRLEQRVRSAGGTIDYAGWVDGADRERFFARIDCLVVPSVWEEPAGLAVNEAYARGIPVIATRAGGLPEYVPDACRDLLVPANDAPALDAAMAKFAADPAHYLPGRPDETRSWDRHVQEILDIYQQAAS